MSIYGFIFLFLWIIVLEIGQYKGDLNIFFKAFQISTRYKYILQKFIHIYREQSFDPI